MAKADTESKQKPKAKRTDKAQYERVLATARKLGVDETGTSFERAFRTDRAPEIQGCAVTPCQR